MDTDKFFGFGMFFIMGLFVLVIFLMFWSTEKLSENIEWCESAGGVPIAGDKGRFKVCLDPSAVITKETTNEH